MHSSFIGLVYGEIFQESLYFSWGKPMGFRWRCSLQNQSSDLVDRLMWLWKVDLRCHGRPSHYPLVIQQFAIENGHLVRWFTMIYLLKMVVFHSYVSLPEGTQTSISGDEVVLHCSHCRHSLEKHCKDAPFTTSHVSPKLATIPGWWFEPLWKIWKSVGMMTFHIYIYIVEK